MHWNNLIAEAQAACEDNDLDLAYARLVDALEFLERCPLGDDYLVETLRPLTELLWGREQHDLCINYLVTQLHAEERYYGMGCLETNISLSRLSELHFKKGNFQQAEAYGRKSFVILLNAYGGDCLDVALAAHTLAVLHQAAGNFPQAERMYARSLSALTRLQADINEVSTVLLNYASLLRLLHRHEEADHLLKCSARAA